jgi:hypothetical protein
MEKPDQHQFQAGWNAVFSWPALGALLFFILLWRMDFPKPMWDDLFYNGAALNMASGGDFSNPFLARQGFPSHYFFVYPPLHSYAVYGWLSVWGVSAASLLAFQNLMYFIIAWMMIILLRRHAAPELFAWLTPWGVTAVFMKTGMRPELLAVASTMLGYVILVHCRRIGFLLWLAFLLMFLGAATSPRTAIFAGTLALAGGWQWMKSTPAKSSRWLQCGTVAGLALGATILIFLVLIGFRFSEFMQTFRLHATRIVADGPWGAFLYFIEFFLGIKWVPLLLLTFLVLCFACRYPAEDPTRLCYWLAAAFLLEALTGALGAGSSWYVIFILLLLATALVKKIPRDRALGLQFIIVSLVLFANSSRIIEVFGIMSGKIDTRPPANRAEVLAVQSTKEHPVLVDPHVSRYVFDYKIPPGFIDFDFAAPFPGFAATTTKLREGDVFLLGPSAVQIFDKATHSHHPVGTWNVLGFKNWTFYRNPRQAYIIPAIKLSDLGNEKKEN